MRSRLSYSRKSINTIMCGNCTYNYSRGTEDAEDLREVCPKGAQRRSERKTMSWQQGDGRADQFRSRSSWWSMTCNESWIYCYDPETKRQFSHWKHAGSPRLKMPVWANHPQTFDDPFFDSSDMVYMHWVSTGLTVNKEYYVEFLREFRKTFRRKTPALLGSVAFPKG